jgi:hypothetical protein
MTNYEDYYYKGKVDKQAGRTMTLPSTVEVHNAYRGYMDGYAGNAFREPVPASYNIDRLHKKGMVTVND